MKKLIFFILSACGLSSCASESKMTPFLDKAEEMYRIVWDLYRVPEHGLFSEYYPDDSRPDLTYFHDETKAAQEVSFLWPMSGVFSSTVALASVDDEYIPYLDSMVVAVERYYDTSRMPFGYQAYPVKMDKVDRYYDDNGLVGIDYIDAYAVTGNPVFLEKAKQVMTFILSGWDERFDGGVAWLEGVDDQKPACSNGKAMVLALKIYEATKDEYYLHTGLKFYNWINKYILDKDRGVVWNSWWTAGEGSIHHDLYTYNTGTLLQAAVALYRFTGDESYLKHAEFLAEGSHEVFFHYTEDGIPFTYNIPWFDLVLFRGYHELYNVNGDTKYVDTMIKALEYAWENARDQKGLVCNDWTGRRDEDRKPKWLLDSSCIPEFYVRIAQIKGEI